MLTAVLGALATFPVPSARQLAWHEMEYYAFVHFGPNTFSGREWGEGKEDPKSFRPTALDPDQWVREFKAAGMRGVILTAKHHDGFCLFPSQHSTHTVREAGQPDVLALLSQACRRHGLKLGVYLSPWDRNHPTYGTPEYNQVFAKTLTETLTKYGDIFEVWFDGANGEGPNGKRQIYDWDLFIRTVREHQPNAVIFSDAGPDIRWVGNEEGWAGDPHWATVNRSRYQPGTPFYKELTHGDPNGSDWLPSECDVSIRPGWFWRESENDKVKTPAQLFDLYLRSVGLGSAFLLNVPPDRRGRIHENDIRALRGFRELREAAFGKPRVAAKHGDLYRLARPTAFRYVELREDIRYGQRVRKWRLETAKGELLAQGESIGRRRIIPVKGKTDAFRLRIEKSVGLPRISNVIAYL